LTESLRRHCHQLRRYPALPTSTSLIAAASFGEGYRPIVVSTKALKPAELAGKRIGVPTENLRVSHAETLESDFEPSLCPSTRLLTPWQNNLVEAGLYS